MGVSSQPTTVFRLKATALFAIIAAVAVFAQVSSADVYIGRFPSLAHGLQGEVFIVNDRQFRIKGFAYDGQGPAVWFMGMKNGTEGIYSADGVAIPNHKGTCLNYRRAYRNADITVTLPRRLRVYDLEALSLYCYEFCHNFGHVKIPRNVRIPPAPATTKSLDQCYPRYAPCRNPGRFF